MTSAQKHRTPGSVGLTFQSQELPGVAAAFEVGAERCRPARMRGMVPANLHHQVAALECLSWGACHRF
jgi:hypothetical protein